jgi:hypothetical protein
MESESGIKVEFGVFRGVGWRVRATLVSRVCRVESELRFRFEFGVFRGVGWRVRV